MKQQLKIENNTLYYGESVVTDDPWFISKEEKRKAYKGFLYSVGLDKIANKLSSRHRGEGYKEAYVQTGITQTTFCKVVNVLVYKKFIEGKERLVNKLGFTLGGKLSRNKVSLINKNHSLLSQCVEDGVENLLPIVLFFGKSPQELKQIFGKSNWKKLCRNSFNRNKLICKSIGPDINSGWEHKEVATAIMRLNELESSLLEFNNGYEYLHYRRLYKNLSKVSWKTFRKSSIVERNFRDWMYGFRDCQRMAKTLGRPFKETWTLEELKKKHDEYTKEYNLIKDRLYQEVIPSVKDFKDYAIDGITVTCLKTPEMLHSEGKEMHHCVYSYVDSVRKGRSVIYSLSSKEERSTLEVGVVKTDYQSGGTSSVYFNRQHKGKYNMEPSNPHEEAAIKLIKLLKEEK